ncbi:MAG: phosphomannomutase/phosphoglucomutase, partial [Pseudomonadota bacterium]
MPSPLTEVRENTIEFLTVPMIKPTGFREYDARWRFPEEINLMGIQALGLGLATQLHESGLPAVVAVGNDYRSYSLSIKQALIVGLMSGGAEVRDIGTCLSPMAYFAQFDLDAQAVAMVTASHNPNGWTGVKMGMNRPLTHGPDEMSRLKEIVMGSRGVIRSDGAYTPIDGLEARYIDDLCGDFR